MLPLSLSGEDPLQETSKIVIIYMQQRRRYFMNTLSTNLLALSSRRLKGIGMLRMVFGLVVAIDAWFKWRPDFINNFTGYLSGSLDGHPADGPHLDNG